MRVRAAFPLAACLIVGLLTLPVSAAALTPSIGPLELVSAMNTSNDGAQIASAGGVITAVWSQDVGPDHMLMVSRKAGRLGAWSTPAPISDPGESVHQRQHIVVADRDGNVTVVWHVYGTWELRTRTLLAGTSDWTPTQTLDSGGCVWTHALARGAGGTLISAWSNCAGAPSVRVSTRAAGSATWSDPVSVALDASPQNLRLATNASGDGLVFVETNDAGTRRLEAVRYTGQTGQLSAPAIVTTGHTANTENPTAALAPGGEAAVMWGDASTGLIRSAWAAAGSNSWSAPETMTAPGKGGDLPTLVSDRDGTFVASYMQGNLDPDPLVTYSSARVVVRYREPGSASWSDPQQPFGDTFGGIPFLTVDDNYNVALVAPTAQALDFSRLPDAIAGLSIKLFYRPDGEQSFAAAGTVYSGPMSIAGGFAGFSQDDDGSPVLALMKAGDGSQRSLEVTVADASPPAATTVSAPETATAGQPATMAATFTDRWSAIDSVDWSFGDGTTASGESVAHTWREAGSYTVAVTATDSAGHRTSATRTVNVAAASAPDDKKTVLPPLIEARLSGRTITLNAKVALRKGFACKGQATATTAFGTQRYRVKVRLRRSGGACRATGTIRLHKTPALRARLRVTIRGSAVRTRTITSRRG